MPAPDECDVNVPTQPNSTGPLAQTPHFRVLSSPHRGRALVLGQPAPALPHEQQLAQSTERKRQRVNRSLGRWERLLWPRAPRISGRAERVLVYRVGMVGDVLTSLPALAAIRRAHPDAELTYLSSPGPRGAPGARELLANSPAIDRLWVYDAEEVAGLSGRLALARSLRRTRFDRLYVLPQELTTPAVERRNLLFFKLAGVRFARGFEVANARFAEGPAAAAHLRGAHLTPDSTGQATFESEPKRLLRIALLAGADPAAGGQPLGESVAAERQAEDLRATYALDRGPLLCLAPGSKLTLKQWPVERFAALAAEWVAGGGTAAILGATAERSLAEDLIELAGDVPIANLCGESDLLTSAELLRSAAGLLSNDTGTMHLGAAVGCPTVAIFSGWDRPGVWDPAGQQWTRLRASVACSPCLAESCGENLACLRAVDVDSVREALAARLGHWPNASHGSRIQERERYRQAG